MRGVQSLPPPPPPQTKMLGTALVFHFGINSDDSDSDLAPPLAKKPVAAPDVDHWQQVLNLSNRYSN